MVCSCNDSNMLTGLPRENTSCTACTKKNHLKRLCNNAEYTAFSLISAIKRIKHASEDGSDVENLIEASKELLERLKAVMEKM